MRVDVVGLLGGVPYGDEAARALAGAEVVVGSPRQLREAAGRLPDEAAAARVPLAGPLDGILDTIAARHGDGRRVCVLASGDPGFFGIVRALGERLGPDRLAVHPAPSSVAMAFARLGLSWDDAAVVSAHGRPLDAAIRTVVHGRVRKAAILTSPDNPPEAVGKALRSAGAEVASVAVVSHIGDAAERVHRLDLDGLADGSFAPLSVVVVVAGGEPAAGPGLAWGLPEQDFAHRGGMITKSEVRAVALGKLALPPTGVLWDVGAGSGSVAIECARLAPGLDVVAVERDPEQAARVRDNAARHGVDVTVVEGEAPAALDRLADPDRVFVGGGGLDVLDAALARLRPGGVVVATYALVGRAVAAHERLGNLVQLAVSRAAPIGALGFRLAPENPVFVCWGPDRPDRATGTVADHVLGVGLASRAEAGELAALVESTLTEAGIPRHRIATVATVDTRATHPALAALGWPVVAYPASELGERAVAEPAALRAAGPGAVLVVPKRRSARATVAVARAGQLGDAHTPSDVRSSRPQKPQVSSS